MVTARASLARIADVGRYFSLAGGIALGQHVAGPIGALPVRHRRRTGPPGYELRPLDQLVAIDVARAVGEDLPNRHPDYDLPLRLRRSDVLVLHPTAYAV